MCPIRQGYIDLIIKSALMQNIEIKRTPTKRSVESLIDDSAIDHEFNHEAHELRKAFTSTIRDLNARIKEQEREITHLRLLVTQKDEAMLEQQVSIKQGDNQLKTLSIQNTELLSTNMQLKKRLHHVEYRLQTMEKNRSAVPTLQEGDSLTNEELSLIRSQERKQIYSEVEQINSQKVAKFTKQMRLYPMSLELEQTIQSFLEELLYLSPAPAKIFLNQKNDKFKSRKVGTISDRKNEKLTDLDEWKLLQKSVQKLKRTQSPSPLHRQKSATINRQKISEETSLKKERSRPVLNYT